MNFESSVESLEALGSAVSAGLALFVPPPDLQVSEWADRFAVLPKESSAQPGKWITATAEYQRGFMNAVNDPLIETIVVIWPAQSGKSAGLLNVVGYFCHQDPSPILFVQPTLEAAENFSKDRIAPMIRDTPSLKPLFGDPRARDSGNTLLHKQFPGGYLALSGANSPSSLASRPIRIVLCDEVDKYDVSAGTEGDPVKLAVARTTTFWNRKIILTSTPNIKGTSRIERAFLKSDQRRYFVTCPHCGEKQTLEWGMLRWPSPRSNPELTEHRPDECYYVCSGAGCEITEADKPEMIRNGSWEQTAVSDDGKTAGFHLNALYSPWSTWPDLIREWLDAQGSVEELKTFVNSKLAETFEPKGDRVEKDLFRDRQHDYLAHCQAPEGVIIVTASVDVQDNRLEAAAIGWGLGEESWALDHRIFNGSPGENGVWEELEEWLQRTFKREDGVTLRIRCTMMDSAGHHTKQAYAFAKRNEKRRVYACVGRANSAGVARPLLSRPTTSNELGVALYTVGVDTAKESFYNRLKIEAEGPGYCHFPVADWADEEYFLQLASEELATVYKGNMAVGKRWKKRRDRNEALDLRVYAMAALERLKPNFDRWADHLKRQATAAAVVPDPVKEILGASSEQLADLPEQLKQKIAINRPSRPSAGGWVNAWR
ncbi:phage terminase large subunit family protein [Silvibacterium acidisoli]|uniref:phage terminase large subunit family protein n=1 Tax=Acidobacteriaceae bacterium ZG23-2 TaxID=2883246 RepID=UPI00406C2E18